MPGEFHLRRRRPSLTKSIRKQLHDTYSFGKQQVDDLLSVSILSLQENLESARQAAAGKNFAAVALYCHTIRGNLLNLGLDQAAAKATRIEEKASRGEQLDFTYLIKEIEEDLKELLSQ